MLQYLIAFSAGALVGLIGYGLGRLSVRRELMSELGYLQRQEDPPLDDGPVEQDLGSPDDFGADRNERLLLD